MSSETLREWLYSAEAALKFCKVHGETYDRMYRTVQQLRDAYRDALMREAT